MSVGLISVASLSGQMVREGKVSIGESLTMSSEAILPSRSFDAEA